MSLRLVFVVLVLLSSSPALAIPTLSLVWRSTGTSTITVGTSAPQLIIADVVWELEAGDDSAGFGVHIVWDDDLKDELDFVGFREFSGVDLGTNHLWSPIIPGPGSGSALIQQESTGSVIGTWGGFDFVEDPLSPVTPGGAVGPQTVTTGSVRFVTNPSNVSDDGGDVYLDIAVPGVDGYLFGDLSACTSDCVINFPAAVVNTPEPGTALLLLGGLCLMARWQHRE